MCASGSSRPNLMWQEMSAVEGTTDVSRAYVYRRI